MVILECIYTMRKEHKRQQEDYTMSAEKEIERLAAQDFELKIRQELLDEANALRKEKGLPPLTEEEAGDIESFLANS
jgi:uncharacterized protein YkwD